MPNKGIFYALGAYLAWGFLPVYWKLLQSVPALEILSHRIVWSLFFMGTILVYKRRWQWLPLVRKEKRILFTFFLSAVVLAINWGTYIWAVNANRVVETSLGYFINPLISVLLGVIFLRERLRRGQWSAIALAALGVFYLTLIYGSLPWISLTLAFSFGTYGLLRKTARLGAIEGLVIETACLFVPAFLYLLFLGYTGVGAVGTVSTTTTVLLLGTGLATAVPLLWFGLAARRLTLTTIGILQYIAPTCQFLIGVFLYHEVVTTNQFVGFCFIWIALIVYSAEGIIHNRSLAKPAGSTAV